MTPLCSRATGGFSKIFLTIAVFALSPSALAVDPARLISQYGHATWRSQDGYLPGMPMTLAQGPDGYLWIGTLNGLVRFDGVQFTRWTAPEGERLPSDAITRLLATPDSLWIGTQQGLSRWKNDELRNYPETPGGAILSITEDREHAIWITRMRRPDSGEYVCRVSAEGEFKCFGDADGLDIPESPCCPQAFLVDQADTVWIGSDTALTAWRNETSKVFKLPLNVGHRDVGVASIAARTEGGLWVGIARAGSGLGLEQFVDGKFAPFVSQGFDTSTLAVSAILSDRRGALWIGTYGQGLYRIYRDAIDQFKSTDGLSNDRVNGIFEDIEGNIWIATTKGVDQFRDQRVTTYTKRQGLSADAAESVAAGRDGSIWIGSAGLDILRDGKIASISKAIGLPGDQVTDLLEDHTGRMWVGVDPTLSVIDQGKFTQVRAKNGKTDIAFISSIAEDAQQDIWARTLKMLFRIRGGAVIEEYPLGSELAGRQVAADPRSGIWLGLQTGDLARFVDGKAQTIAFAKPPGATINGFVEHMATTPDGAVFGATANGIVAWKDGKAQTLTTANGLPCNHGHAPLNDKNGDLWLFMQCGLVQISRSEIGRWWASSDARLRLRVFDGVDGVDPGWAPFTAATMSPDGRLWFANGHSVQMIDPAMVTSNRTAPPVHIEALFADRVGYSIKDGLQLPPRVRDVHIDYTATSFAIPQRVQFRYRLDGRDADWQEPVARRQAFYTDLQPGDYRFTVIACDADGVWNEHGDSFSFRIPPAWYQTMAFRVVVALLCMLIVWFAFHWRMRRLSAAMSARFDERLAERLRIARELHDTLLQTVQAGKLVADDALGAVVDDERRRHALERISSWLGEAIREGRAALNALRRSTVLSNDLAEGLQQVADECASESGMVIRVSVAGRTREMHPIVRDEIYRIGYEAIRNAASHSHGRTLEVELTYAHDLSLRVKDDGIGIEAAEAQQGKPGHFGLQGMRERAERIGAKLSVARLSTGGTEVRLHVPGRTVFR